MRNRCLFFSSVASVLGVAFALGLSGCSANFGDVSTASTQTAMHIRGVVHGGQQPISGSHVYMYAASTAAYGGNGIAPTSGATGNASTSLLTAATGNPADTNGNFYVTTDTFGDFDINGAFACTSGQQVYLYSTGGDPQLAGTGVAGTPNPAASLLAVVGDCSSSAFPGVTSVAMNEITTMVAAYTLAGFATDPLHIGAPSAVTGHALSGTGLANAFTTALNVVDQASGTPHATFPDNNQVTVPVESMNTVADFLAACINSTGASSSGCSTLFANTNNGTAPTDTATAAIHLAQNPTSNLSALLNLATNASPFQPFSTRAKTLALTLNYSGGGLNQPDAVAIDGAGNAWVTNSGGSSVTGISSNGTYLSGANGYAGGGINNPEGIAIDGAGNIWASSFPSNSVTKLSNDGAFLSGANGYTGGGLNGPGGIAFDGAGNAWVTNTEGVSMTELSSTGTVLSGANGYIGGGVNGPFGVAIDGSGNAWVANLGENSVVELSNTGVFLSGANGYTDGNLFDPFTVAIDSSGNVWVVNLGGNTVTKYSNTGAVLSGAKGYIGSGLSEPSGIAIDGAGNVWVANSGHNTVSELSSSGTIVSGTGFYTDSSLSEPYAIAVDGSGNVWVANAQGNSVTEIVGVAAPVITPLVAGLPVVPTKDGSSNLGTRP
ncbi:virginiamycin B lyase family protein [Granulicella mallensis]|uniref:NHL repeat containing protein n=1 Tax=Granulicella mallensis (strain ATCC BAA-1857 / DSM 23137 / MP5ACTX8) TaxID=682795 RepID=G8NPY3_GRAMM|nr:hypothetical protein [Granulicella mallensis]AEU38317.1 NHL repeat containing protein [Granulicella mallensis MP5ACTX8]